MKGRRSGGGWTLSDCNTAVFGLVASTKMNESAYTFVESLKSLQNEMKTTASKIGSYFLDLGSLALNTTSA